VSVRPAQEDVSEDEWDMEAAEAEEERRQEAERLAFLASKQ